MKPPLFHVGQAVICLRDDWDTRGQSITLVPRKNKLYTVSEMVYKRPNWNAWWDFRKAWVVRLAELPKLWDQNEFAPVELLSDEALAELLAETLEPVTA